MPPTPMLPTPPPSNSTSLPDPRPRAARGRTRAPGVAGALALLLLPLLAHAGPADVPAPLVLPELLTLDDALKIFRQRGFDLLIAEAGVLSAEGDLSIAGAAPNPNAAIGLYRSFFAGNLFETSYGWFVGVGDSAAISDTLSGKRGLRRDVAGQALKAARLTRSDAQRTLELQVKSAYFQALQARALRDFAVEVAKAANQAFALTEVRYKAGAISEADVARVETAKLEADQALDTADQTLRQTKVGLAFLLGVRTLVPDYSVDVDLIKFRVPEGVQSATRDRLLRDALDHRPDLRLLAAQEQRASAAIALAQRNRFPDLSLNLQYSQQGSTTGIPCPSGDTTCQVVQPISPPTLQFSVGGTLPVLYQQQGEIQKAEADLASQRLQRAKAEAQVVSDVESAWASYVAQRKLVERMESRLLDRARRARDLVAVQYQKGAASLLEFLDAQRTYISTNVEYFQDLTGYWTAVFQLEGAVGMDLR